MINYIKRYWQFLVFILFAVIYQVIYPDMFLLKTLGMIVIIWFFTYRLNIETIKLYDDNKAIRRIFAGKDNEFSVMEKMAQTNFFGSVNIANAMIVTITILTIYFLFR